MTTKEASGKFNISAKIIRKSINDGMLTATKHNGKYNINDDIKFIPIKHEIQAFLFQILKYKNNNNIALNRSLAPNDDQLKIIIEYLFLKGFIAQYEFNPDINILFNQIILTDAGINFSIGRNIANERNNTLIISLPINIALINT